eukprot:2185426-Prymnesium_polylepis.1
MLSEATTAFDPQLAPGISLHVEHKAAEELVDGLADRSARRRCRILTSRRSNDGLLDTGYIWPHLALIDTRPLNTVRMQFGLPTTGGGLGQRTERYDLQDVDPYPQ